MPRVSMADLVEVLAEVVDPGPRPGRATRLGEDIPLDSREMLRVLALLQARYHVRFDLRVLLQLRTLGDVQDAIEAQLEDSPP